MAFEGEVEGGEVMPESFLAQLNRRIESDARRREWERRKYAPNQGYKHDDRREPSKWGADNPDHDDYFEG